MAKSDISYLNEEVKLIKVLENFFTYNNTKFHELLYIYRLENKDINRMDNFKTLDKDDSFNE